MTAPIEDVSSLPGKKVTDQEEVPIGEIKDIYAIDGDGHVTYVTVETSEGMGKKRTVFIPLARLKDEDGDVRVPYSKQHISNTPEVDASDGISPECDRLLRDHYGIDRADQELRSDHQSYATLVPEDTDGSSQRVEDPDNLETPDPDRRTDETKERLHDPGGSSTRDVDAGKIADQNAELGSDDDDQDDGEKDEDSGDAKREASGEAKGEHSGGGDGGDEDTADDETGEEETAHRRGDDSDD
jgi:sporulation protein YlmC with PRC-barrel domain